MSEYESCQICGNDAVIEYSSIQHQGGTLSRSRWKLYCSKACQYRGTWKLHYYIGLFFVVLGFVFLLPAGIGFAFFMWIIGSVPISQAYYQKNYWLKEGKGNNVWNKSSQKPLTRISTSSRSEKKFIYSNILKDNVRPCCHQSARLKDKYCACGRALEYPAVS